LALHALRAANTPYSLSRLKCALKAVMRAPNKPRSKVLVMSQHATAQMRQAWSYFLFKSMT
jgi:hypothetical protein